MNLNEFQFFSLEGKSLTLIPCDLSKILEATILEYKEIQTERLIKSWQDSSRLPVKEF